MLLKLTLQPFDPDRTTSSCMIWYAFSFAEGWSRLITCRLGLSHLTHWNILKLLGTTNWQGRGTAFRCVREARHVFRCRRSSVSRRWEPPNSRPSVWSNRRCHPRSQRAALPAATGDEPPPTSHKCAAQLGCALHTPCCHDHRSADHGAMRWGRGGLLRRADVPRGLCDVHRCLVFVAGQSTSLLQGL